jgi:hypothetical protein
MGWFKQWFGYGLGAGVARTIFGEEHREPGGPIRHQTEEQIRADERRYDEDARRLEAEDAAVKRRPGG